MSCFSWFIFQLHQRLSCVRNWGISLLSAPELRFMLADFKHMHTCTWLETKSKKWMLTYWGGAGPSVVLPDLQLLHLSWDQPPWLFQLRRNPESIQEHARIKVKPTATWNRNEGASFLSSKTYYFHNAALKNLLSLHVLETHFWQRGFYLINCISMYTSEKIRCNLCASVNF